MFTLSSQTDVKVSDAFGNITLNAGTNIPCILNVLSADGSSSEAIFINTRLKATTFQPPMLLEEEVCWHVLGFHDYRTVQKDDLPTTVDLEGTLYLVNPPLLQGLNHSYLSIKFILSHTLSLLSPLSLSLSLSLSRLLFLSLLPLSLSSLFSLPALPLLSPLSLCGNYRPVNLYSFWPDQAITLYRLLWLITYSFVFGVYAVPSKEKFVKKYELKY
jgi:hypothetical protein